MTVRRRLGREGPWLTATGPGTWIMGGAGWRMGWGPQDDADSIRTLRSCWDQGANWVDTAPIYGLGHAEEVLGRAMDGYGDVLVFSKCGMSWGDDGELGPIDLRPETVLRECRRSLTRLGRDNLDLLQLHFPDDDVPVEETWGAMSTLVDDGLVRWLGISNHGLDDLRRAHAVRRVDAVQLRLHVLDQRNLHDVVPWCRDEEVGVLAYSPLASGLLAAPVDLERLDEDDWRRTDERFRQEHDGTDATLRVLASATPGDPALAATAWTIAQPGVTAAVLGVREPDHVPLLERARAHDLTQADLDAITAAPGPLATAERPLWR